MQGINPLTGACTYKTPCGWCTKWDKKCDKKIPERGKRATLNPIDDYISTTLTNKICETEEDHRWECCGISTGGSTYVCKICGKHKTEPVKSSDNTTISTYAGNIKPLCGDCMWGTDFYPHCIDCNASNNFQYFEEEDKL